MNVYLPFLNSIKTYAARQKLERCTTATTVNEGKNAFVTINTPYSAVLKKSNNFPT